MKSYLFFLIAILFISPSVLVFADTHPANLKQRIDNTTLSASDNFKLSPYTGYTRAHWLEINEKLIAGAMPYFNVETGVPEILLFPKASAFEKIYQKEDRFPDLPRRVLERLLMTVVVYTKATGNDTVPGYKAQ